MNDLGKKLAFLKSEYENCFINNAQIIGQSLENLSMDAALMFLEKEKAQLKKEYFQLMQKRNNYKCIGCGVCCKFAVSEFSPEELNIKAQNGDNYAKQFTSVFTPYDDTESVTIFPEYFELLKSQTQGKFYIYHCPKVTKDNRCPDYDNRPQICRDFPDNPIAFLPPLCGFNKWKNETETLILNINAKMNIIEFYQTKIKEAQ